MANTTIPDQPAATSLNGMTVKDIYDDFSKRLGYDCVPYICDSMSADWPEDLWVMYFDWYDDMFKGVYLARKINGGRDVTMDQVRAAEGMIAAGEVEWKSERVRRSGSYVVV